MPAAASRKRSSESERMELIMSKEWLDSQDVMFLLNISKRELQSMRTQSEIPYAMIGKKKIYYKRRDIEALLEKLYPSGYS